MKELFTDEEFRNAKSEDKLPLRCEECGCVFYSVKKAIKYEREHKRGRCKFCSRSLNEIYFSELCKNYFKEEILCNESIFNGWDADVILKDSKIAVLWNGAWHYKTITKKHSLKQVKNRDKIKIDEIKKCGYTPYIIKDMGKHNKEFVEKEFNKFLDFVKN